MAWRTNPDGNLVHIKHAMPSTKEKIVRLAGDTAKMNARSAGIYCRNIARSTKRKLCEIAEPSLTHSTSRLCADTLLAVEDHMDRLLAVGEAKRDANPEKPLVMVTSTGKLKAKQRQKRQPSTSRVTGAILLAVEDYLGELSYYGRMLRAQIAKDLKLPEPAIRNAHEAIKLIVDKACAPHAKD